MLGGTSIFALSLVVGLHFIAAVDVDLFITTNPQNPRAKLLSPDASSVMSGLTKLTVCVNIFVQSANSKGSKSLVSYSSRQSRNYNELLISVGIQDEWLSVDILKKQVLFIGVEFKPDDWNHICVTWDGTSGEVILYLNGIGVDYEENIAVGKKIGGDGYLILGQDQDYYDSYYELDDGFTGFLTDFQLWSRVLTDDEVAAVVGCDKTVTGDLVNWKDSMWGYQDNIMVIKSLSPCATQCPVATQ